MADAWLARLAAYGLPGAEPLVAPEGGIGLLVPAMVRHKLIGVAAAALIEGGLVLRDTDHAAVAEAHEAAMRESLLLEEMLLEAVGVLDQAGVDHRVLKGTALAHLIHDDPSDRSFGDNDLLLSPQQIDDGVAALVAAGAVRPVPPLSGSFDRRFAKSVTLRWRGGTELDVHRTLAPGPFGLLIDLGDLARDPVEFLLAGRALLTFPNDRHLLHGAMHVALGDVDARLGNIRDVALLAARPDIDPVAFAAMAQRWRCAAPVATGLRSTTVLGHTRSAIERWADEMTISEEDRSRLEVYDSRRGRFRAQAMASWRVLGWRDRAAFARALLVPSAANRAARGRGRTDAVAGLARASTTPGPRT